MWLIELNVHTCLRARRGAMALRQLSRHKDTETIDDKLLIDDFFLQVWVSAVPNGWALFFTLHFIRLAITRYRHECIPQHDYGKLISMINREAIQNELRYLNFFNETPKPYFVLELRNYFQNKLYDFVSIDQQTSVIPVLQALPDTDHDFCRRYKRARPKGGG